MRRKITVREERIKEIEKAYQTKHLPNKILITKQQIHKKNKEEISEAPIDFIEERMKTG